MRSQKTDAEQKFEEILQRFEIPLLQYAARITGDKERARDVVQETFVKFQRNGAMNRADEPTTWLFTVCRNSALNVCRKERRMMYLGEEATELRETEEPLPFDRLDSVQQNPNIVGGRLHDLGNLLIAKIALKFELNHFLLPHWQCGNDAQQKSRCLRLSLKTLRQRYGEIAGDFIPFKPRTTK